MHTKNIHLHGLFLFSDYLNNSKQFRHNGKFTSEPILISLVWRLDLNSQILALDQMSDRLGSAWRQDVTWQSFAWYFSSKWRNFIRVNSDSFLTSNIQSPNLNSNLNNTNNMLLNPSVLVIWKARFCSLTWIELSEIYAEQQWSLPQIPVWKM